MERQEFDEDGEIIGGELPEEVNERVVTRIVNKYSHPHPIYVVVIGLVVVFMIYVIYIIFVKNCIRGSWFNGDQPVYVYHNRLTDSVSAAVGRPGQVQIQTGYMVGNALYLDNESKRGILYKDKIEWIGTNEVWKRTKITV
jgi:hypothetical protein